MLIRDLIKQIPCRQVIGDDINKIVEFASTDSRLLFENSIFVIRKGAKFDAFEFIFKVRDKVNCFIVSGDDADRMRLISNKLSGKVFLVVDDLSVVLKKLSKVFHEGLNRLNIIGVTGTNGKTTVSLLINSILNKAGLSSAVLGTVYYKWRGVCLESLLTTLDNFMLKSVLSRIYKDNVKNVVLEISSHGLEQARIDGLCLRRAIFTNLSQDHFDYHKNFRNYFQAKLKIFGYLGKKGIALVNIDDKFGSSAYRILRVNKLSFGIKQEAFYRARAYRLHKHGLEFLINIRSKDYIVRSRLLGEFNIYNILAALSCCGSLGLNLDKVLESINLFKRPPGRLEMIKDGIFVDYAHTPSALREAILALRQANFDKIIVVFGCGGDRDKTKRPKMGKVVSLYSDYTIITSDNPRSEDPAMICHGIRKGLLDNNYEIILDRKKAIEKAIRFKKDQSTAVLIAGKGHEAYQVFSDRKISFSDRQVVRKLAGDS